MCNSDITLEEVDISLEKSGERKRPLPGEGVTHKCRDWKAVYDWTVAQHAQRHGEDEIRTD